MAKTKIHGEYLDPSVISGQTQVTAVGADSMLIFDATDNALKKALLSDLIETVGATPSFTSATISGDLTVDTSTLKVDSSNNRVGIGISSPDGTCHIHSGSAGTITAAASGNNLVVENSGAVGMSLLFDDAANNAYGNIYWGNETDGSADGRITYFGSTYVTAADRQSMAFRTANTEAMRINSNGRVMVGTTSINGAMGNFVAPNGVTGLNIFQSQGSGSHTLVAFNVSGGGVGVGTITTNSSATAYNTSSDARLKNILGEAKGLEIINKLNPVNFEWKESKEIQDGLIAQEVMDIVPNAVTGSEEDYYQMDYSKLVTPLIKAIQELSAEVEELKAKLENK